jgi:hypothetical protein
MRGAMSAACIEAEEAFLQLCHENGIIDQADPRLFKMDSADFLQEAVMRYQKLTAPAEVEELLHSEEFIAAISREIGRTPSEDELRHAAQESISRENRAATILVFSSL